MKNTETHQKDSGTAEIWVIRLILFSLPVSIGYGAWKLSTYLFELEAGLGQIFNWIATLAVMVILLQLFNALAIDLPRARRRARFRAERTAPARGSN